VTIILQKATFDDAETLHSMQVKSFLSLLEKHKDHATNPACESISKTLERINDPLRGFFKIMRNNVLVGGIAIKQTKSGSLFLGPIFVDPNFQNQKIAQTALKVLEDLFSDVEFFELAVIAQEEGSIHLYEKMGYVATGEIRKINEYCDILFYRKKIR